VLATFLFAFAPRAFGWEIAGGGLTRSTGFFFAILAIYCLYRLTKAPTWRSALLATGLVALTVYCHMEMAWFVAWTYALILVAYGRSPRPIFYAAAVTAGVLALAAPWLGLVISRHGLEPFLAAGQTGNQSLIFPAMFFFLNYTQEPFFPLLAALGIMGFLASLANGRYFLPAWFFLVFVLDPRKSPTYATLPMAMLAAEMTLAVLVPAMQQMRWPSKPSRLAGFLPAIVVMYALMSGLTADVVKHSPLRSLPPAEQEAMAWVAANTPVDSRFLVIAGREPGPWIDTRSEWFPALSNRVSLATVQGSEWLSGERGLDPAIERYDSLQMCADLDRACIAAWAAEYGLSYGYIYVGKPSEEELREETHGSLLQRDCCAALRASLAASADYALIYENDGAQIYELLPAEMPAEAASRRR
jgi:hypothetical protein